ncbi:MAG: sulfite exporter TauE/SafE family protein [Alphaproteobacteria bacterium]
MQIYLPIAEMSVDVFLLLALGSGIGFLSGLFGVGGGFLLTPLLIFIGIPPAVAVASGANQIIAPSVVSALAHWRRGNVDIRMGMVLLAGGAVGVAGGTVLFGYLRKQGQIDLVIQASYVVLLVVIGVLMLQESVRAMVRRYRATGVRRRLHEHYWVHRWPLRMRFPRSKLYMSVVPPILLGAAVGVISSILGVGGGFVMVPAMIYLLGMPTLVVVGTSLFQVVFVTALVSLLQAGTQQTVDLFLSLLLLAGGIFGAQLGTRVGEKLRGDQLRVLLALVILAVAGRIVYELVATPSDPFSLSTTPVG